MPAHNRKSLLRNSVLTASAALLCIATAAIPAWAAPATMKAIVQTGAGGPEVLKLETIPTPQPGMGEVRIRVVAAAVNPTDVRLRLDGASRDTAKANADKEVPLIPGQDVAGYIDAVGPGVTTFKVGDKVFANLTRRKGYAEYVVASVDDVAMKPKSFTFEQTAGIPTAGVAGWRAIEQAKLQKGQKIAIIGAAGGVGSTVVQFAKAKGAYVVGDGSAWQDDFMKRLGVDEIVNHDKDDVAAKIKNMDVVVNTVGGEKDHVLGYVKRGGILVSIVGLPPKEQCAAAGVTCITYSATQYDGLTKSQTLPVLAKMADAGQYNVEVEKVFPLEQAGAAQEMARTRTEGKIILAVTSESNKK
jgi:NADPH:quinone reductase-like Zn-dependent oxidoreductase